MLSVLNQWYRRYFSDPQAGYLIFFFATVSLLAYFLGKTTVYIIVAFIILHLLDALIIGTLMRFMPRWIAFFIVFVLFFVGVISFFVWLLPTLVDQFNNLAAIDLKKMIANFQTVVNDWLPESPIKAQLHLLIEQAKTDIGQSENLFISLAATYGLYSLQLLTDTMLLVILSIMFISLSLWDKEMLMNMLLERLLPSNHGRFLSFLKKLGEGVGLYFRGKVLESLIMLICTLVLFYAFGLKYTELLSLVVALSVFLPYVGIAFASIPVLIVSYQQFGLDNSFYLLGLLYLATQLFDGYILVTLLFSRISGIHPALIVLSLMIFSGLWGSFGLVIAIPLAIAIKITIQHWPVSELDPPPPPINKVKPDA